MSLTLLVSHDKQNEIKENIHTLRHVHTCAGSCGVQPLVQGGACRGPVRRD